MKTFMGALILLCIPVFAFGDLCDTAWDADRIIGATTGRPAYLRVPLKRKDGSTDDITLAQIRPFYDAKQRISQVAGLSPTFLICGDRSPNAFAIPSASGDVVGVTIGMLRVVDGDANMAAAVIGHETAHHTKHHMSAAQTRDAILGLIGIVAGLALDYKIQQRHNVQGIGVDLGQIGATLVSRKFSRDQEREADAVAFQYLIASGFNPNGAVTLAERFVSLGPGGGGWFFDTHPGWEERAGLFRAMIAKSPGAQQIIARAASAQQIEQREPARGDQTIAFIAPTYQESEAQRSFQAAALAYQNKEFLEAYEKTRSAAVAGYVPAQVLAGYLLEEGLGVPKDDPEAVHWFRMAADKGNGLGQNNLGLMYENGRGGLPRDDTEAVRLYRKATDRGDALGQNNLGRMYASGRGGLTKDDTEAVRLYRMAAEQGNAFAQANLGYMYGTGRGGLPKNDTEAVRLYRMAAEQGHAIAQNNLGAMYALGNGGLPIDYTEAVRLYRMAAEQGLAGAQGNLGFMYQAGRGGLPQDDTEAVRWYRKAADQNDAQAQYSLGSMYEYGRGVLQDKVEAIRWYRKAAEQGFAPASAKLSQMKN